VTTSRRTFLESTGQALGGLWLATHWRAVAAAAHDAHGATASTDNSMLTSLSVAEAADVDALCACIVPGGRTPGAREARTVVFIDRVLSTCFADRRDAFLQGLTATRHDFETQRGKAFAEGGADEQIAFMTTIDTSQFFGQLRFLTILGLLSSPRYGGNHQGAGWQLIGFVEEHVFSPPFGYYDRDYEGFELYPPAGDPGSKA
jgi:hypothetical protein